MARYLVVAHQTATSPELLDRLGRLVALDTEATFTVLVPATPASHLLTWEEGEARSIARQRAEDATQMLEHTGITVARAMTGDASPIQAIADELETRPGAYDAIVLSTFPPGISRWLGLDAHRQAERRFNLPVVHVIAQPARKITPAK